VVEIIKREYLKTLEMTPFGACCQAYTSIMRSAYLEQDEWQDAMPSEEDRAQALAMALEGKN